jgi:hypothetical protein
VFIKYASIRIQSVITLLFIIANLNSYMFRLYSSSHHQAVIFRNLNKGKLRICNNTSTSKTPWPSSHSTNMQDLLFSVGKAKCFPLNTLKEYLRVEVQFHAFLTSENDKREVKSQFHPIIALFRINGLQCRLSG